MLARMTQKRIWRIAEILKGEAIQGDDSKLDTADSEYLDQAYLMVHAQGLLDACIASLAYFKASPKKRSTVETAAMVKEKLKKAISTATRGPSPPANTSQAEGTSRRRH
jgi:hypothetical protein